MIKILLILILAQCWATSESAGAPDGGTAPAGGLPLCVDNPAEIAKIKSVMQANRKSNHKYDGYRAALQSDSDTELFARLAYAETLAANCKSEQEGILPLISEAIGNRVRLRKGNVRGVLFSERDQFASSMNAYGESRYLDFLCPKDQALWDLALARAKDALAGKPGSLAADSVNYFLYQHSPKWTKEPWPLKEDGAGSSKAIRRCVRFFHNPKWK